MRPHDGFVISFDRRSVTYVYAISQYIFRGTNVSRFPHPNIDFDYVTYVEPDVAACTFNDDDTDTAINPTVNASFNAWVNGESSAHPSFTGVEDTRWEARTASHLSMEEVNRDQVEDEDEHDDEGEYEGEHKDDGYEGRGKDEHNEVNGDDSVYEPPVIVVRRNPPRDPHPLSCSTHSPRRC
ncbi:hypothetical protein Gotur_007741 [Gossypium turneri]